MAVAAPRWTGFRRPLRNRQTYPDTRRVRFRLVERGNGQRALLVRDLTCMSCKGWMEAARMDQRACSVKCAAASPKRPVHSKVKMPAWAE